MDKGKRDPSASPAAARLFGPGKKRILTLDGGGVRGIVTIAFLKEMEQQLRKLPATILSSFQMSST